jgi:hypothetical protein
MRSNFAIAIEKLNREIQSSYQIGENLDTYLKLNKWQKEKVKQGKTIFNSNCYVPPGFHHNKKI